MRLRKVLKFLFLLSLALVLFGGEVVESACFVNDVSNDYIQAPASPVHQLAKKTPTDRTSPNIVKVVEQLMLKLAVAPSVESCFFSSPDLLQLLSIQRK